MNKARAVAGWNGWRRTLSVRLAPFFLLIFATFLFNSLPTPVLAAPLAITLDQGDGNGDGEPQSPTYVNDGRDCDPDDLDPYSLGVRRTYLNHVRYCGRAGALGPQVDDLGDMRGFVARGPPVIRM